MSRTTYSVSIVARDLLEMVHELRTPAPLLRDHQAVHGQARLHRTTGPSEQGLPSNHPPDKPPQPRNRCEFENPGNRPNKSKVVQPRLSALRKALCAAAAGT